MLVLIEVPDVEPFEWPPPPEGLRSTDGRTAYVCVRCGLLTYNEDATCDLCWLEIGGEHTPRIDTKHTERALAQGVVVPYDLALQAELHDLFVPDRKYYQEARVSTTLYSFGEGFRNPLDSEVSIVELSYRLQYPHRSFRTEIVAAWRERREFWLQWFALLKEENE